MQRRKDDSGEEYVSGGEIFDQVAREGLPKKVMFEEDLESVGSSAYGCGGGVLQAERTARGKPLRWGLVSKEQQK